MRRRKLLVTLAGISALVCSVGAVKLAPEAGRITAENYERIVSDMSPADVEAVFGPPGDYRTAPADHCGPALQAWLEPERSHPFASEYAQRWYGDSGTVFVRINQDGQILKEFTPCQRRGRVQSLLWRIKRLYHSWFPGVRDG